MPYTGSSDQKAARADDIGQEQLCHSGKQDLVPNLLVLIAVQAVVTGLCHNNNPFPEPASFVFMLLEIIARDKFSAFLSPLYYQIKEVLQL